MPSARRFVRLTAALLTPVALVACSGTIAGPSRVSSTPIASLTIETNAVWQLQAIAIPDGPPLPIEDPSLFTLMLTDEGRVSARVDCNRASGGYTINGNTLSIGPMASTRAYCATAPVDQQFLMLLGGENIVTTSGATLELSSRRGTLTFSR